MATSRRRVLLISADGMRPDLFDEKLMPTVAGLMRDGVYLQDYHASYPTHSRVNITTISTGCLPGRHGIAANVFRVDGATVDGVIDTGDFKHIQQLDVFTGGAAIQKPTIPEILAWHGKRSQVVATSSDAAGLIWNRRDPEAVFDLNLSVRRPGIEAVRAKLGPVPPEPYDSRIPHVEYTARAMSDHYLDDDELDFIAVWLSEPDFSLYHYGIGSPEVRDALQTVDRAVETILGGLERRGIREQFDVFLISDHGHSSIIEHRSLGEFMDRAIRAYFPHLSGLVTASDFIYPSPGSETPSADDLAPLVEWIQDQPWCGSVLVGRKDLEGLPGVLPLVAVWGGFLGTRAPLLAVTPAWSHASNHFGMPGTIAGLTEQSALRATHGSASPYELHAFAVLSGPSFSVHQRSTVAAGAQDLAPTICRLLEIPDAVWFDGRILTEALIESIELPGRVGTRVMAPLVPRSPGFRPALIVQEVEASRYLHSAVNARSAVHHRADVIGNDDRGKHEKVIQA